MDAQDANTKTVDFLWAIDAAWELAREYAVEHGANYLEVCGRADIIYQELCDAISNLKMMVYAPNAAGVRVERLLRSKERFPTGNYPIKRTTLYAWWQAQKQEGVQDTAPINKTTKPRQDTETLADAPVSARRILKKAELIRELQGQWPTIENDIKETSRGGIYAGLAATRDGHGRYDVEAARNWAEENGRITTPRTTARWMFDSPTTHRHTLK